jgi:hypothetical protein
VVRYSGKNWIHHVERMEPEHIPKQSVGYIPRRIRSTRCPKLHWKDQPVYLIEEWNVSKGPSLNVDANKNFKLILI